MENSNWNVDQMLHWLDIKINREDRDIYKQMKQINNDFLHFFEWNAESLYKSHFMSKCYKELRNAVGEKRDIDYIQKVLQGGLSYCQNKLLEGQLDYHSSSRTTNVAHFLKLECMQQLIKDYRELANILSLTPPEENLRQSVKRTEKDEQPPKKLIQSGIRR